MDDGPSVAESVVSEGAMDHSSFRWFHSIALRNGEVTKGDKPSDVLLTEADLYFRGDRLVRGKSFLDIGAWDGFMSFEAERRGASRVVATDHFCWSGPGWGSRRGFDFAHANLGSSVEAVEVDVPDLDPSVLGQFDVVLFAGVLYHLRHPFLGLEHASSLTRDLLIVETATSMNHVLEPVLRYHLGAELNGDPTNFWTPNERCLRDMLTELGFKRIDTVITSSRGAPRLVAHAWR